ncbi:MAG: hypothetical protein AAF645_11365 [Myxococcota bacterium]
MMMIRRRPQEREGAVMLVVMLVLMMTTATAVFAVHATSSEIRAAGFSRQAMQTQYIGESGVMAAFAWVDFFGADALRQAMTQSSEANRAGGGPALDLQPFERQLRDGADAHRFYPPDFNALAGAPLDDDGSVGPRSAYDSFLLVDVYDRHRVVRPIPGGQAQGGGRLEYLGATYTSRGRTRLPGDFQTAVVGDRPFHEGASDARAFAVSGPIGRN